MLLGEAISQWDWYDGWIRESCYDLRNMVYDIEQEINFQPELICPEVGENLKSFKLVGNILHTEWEYIDGYEAICDSHSTWEIPLEWFTMTKEQLADVLVKQAMEREERDREFAIRRIRQEAEFYNLKIGDE